jgi:PAS domain S-box-containing protein
MAAGSSSQTTGCGRKWVEGEPMNQPLHDAGPGCNPAGNTATRELASMLSSALVRSVLDSLPDAMVIIDSAGRILFANSQVEALFGFNSDDIVNGPVEVLLPERFRQRHVGHRSGYSHNVRVRPMGMGLDLFATRKDGSEFPVEISLSPIKLNDEMLVAAAIRDVTQRRQVEQALKEARRDAEHANLAKSRFLATASHDLRQPLQTLALLNGALRRMITDADCKEVLEQQDLAIDAMSRLLNALLDISRLESGAIKLELADFEIAPLFDEMRREFSNLAANKGLRLSIDAPRERVHSDSALVSQVLRNLVSNAIKYTQKGTVELRCERRGPDIRVEVRDTGVGIPPDQVALIFEEFYQIGVSPNSSRDGYGLGLSIVQRIARLLGIHVEVHSAPGTGSVFAFELPAARGSPDQAHEPAAGLQESAAAVAAAHLLLVEDEPGVRNAMRMLLSLEGYQVTAVGSADEAMARLRAGESFDLLVTDFHLGDGQTGTQVISAARELRGAALRAILVTGDTSSAVRELQVDENLRITSKPINSSELLQLVKTLLAG